MLKMKSITDKSPKTKLLACVISDCFEVFIVYSLRYHLLLPEI